MKKILLTFLFPLSVFSQVVNPHNSSETGLSERVANFTVSGAGNDRLEIANGTQNSGKFIPTFWSYRDTDNTFSMVFTSSISGASLDNGSSPLMLFTTTIAPEASFSSPGNGIPFVWGDSGTYLPIVNRPLFEWRNSSQKLMTIDANGDVGIATNTPSARLHVMESVRFEGLQNKVNPSFMLGTDTDGNVAEYPVPSGAGSIADADWLKPDNTPSYDINESIYTNGNVGIKVQNPSSVLHVNGTIRFQNLPDAGVANFMLGTDANGNVAEYPVPNGAGNISDADWLKPDNTLPMNINDNIYTNGKVGINTSDFPEMVGDEDISGYNLFVTGGILTEEVRVALVDEWADYVFKEDYNLAPLSEVEKHIKENGHLKNIPSEAEVKKNGIELAQMNKQLLEKVEELTLYMIEMNKRLEAQQKEIDSLKKKG